MKRLVALSLLAVSITGCSTTARMDVTDLNHYRIDCSRRDEQLAFLKGHMPNQTERITNGMRMTSPVGFVQTIADGTFHEERAMFDRRQQAIARMIIGEIESNCPVQIKPQGCVHINESFPSGDAQGARCYQSRNPRPVVNRWEVMLDSK